MNYTIFEPSPNQEHLIIGSLYSILALAVFPLSIPIVYTLHTTKELNENVSYKLINALNICDLLQSGSHFLTGFFVAFPILANQIDPIVRIMGSTTNTLWIASFVIIAVLALTRLGVTFCNMNTDRWQIWMKIILTIGAFYIFGIWIIGCVTLNFQLVGVSWSYDFTVVYTETLANMELYFCFPILLLSFTSYVLILGNILKKKRHAQSTSSYHTEIGILAQATVLTTYMGVLIALWHNAESWFPMTDITAAFLHGGWIMFPHLNVVLLISTNRRIRRNFMASFKGSLKRITSVNGTTSDNAIVFNRRSRNVP